MFNSKSYIVKGLGILLFTTMLLTFLCSGLCISEIYMCCDDTKGEMECCGNTTNKGVEHSGNPGDCQQAHLAFFQTISQFHSKDIVTVLQPVRTPDQFYTPVISNESILEMTDFEFSTDFHPPPPKDGISVFVQSFLI